MLIGWPAWRWLACWKSDLFLPPADMFVIWIFRWFIPYWDEMIVNPATGKASQKNVFQVFYGLCGVGGAGVAIWADVKEHRPVNTATILFLLLAGLGLAGLKIWQQQANRETATPEGMPLAAPLPPGDVPAIMPQVENPNAPTGQTEQ
jgi:hypothetical protein